MSGEPVPTSIQILDKEYVVSCPEEERDALLEAAVYLDDKMREARDGAHVLGTERIAVMAALNVIHDYLELKHESQSRRDDLQSGINRLEARITESLGRRDRQDALD